jgi:dihydrofolate reductase
VHAAVPGDAHFPALEMAHWRELVREDYSADERHAHAFSFITLERVSP